MNVVINITHTCRNICESVISNHHSILLQYPNLKVSPIKGRTLLKLLIDSSPFKVKKCSLCEKKIYNTDLKFCFCCGSPVRERCIYDARKELIKSKKKKKTIIITLENGLEIIKQEEVEDE